MYIWHTQNCSGLYRDTSKQTEKPNNANFIFEVICISVESHFSRLTQSNAQQRCMDYNARGFYTSCRPGRERERDGDKNKIHLITLSPFSDGTCSFDDVSVY